MDIQKLWPDINNSRRQMPYHATAPMRKTLDRAVIVIYPCMDAACFETMPKSASLIGRWGQALSVLTLTIRSMVLAWSGDRPALLD
jgi:hypothetical protein